MKIGDTVRFSKAAVNVYGFDSDIGLIVDKVPQSTYSAAQGYPDDYQILINGKVELIGSQIDAEGHVEVIDEST